MSSPPTAAPRRNVLFAVEFDRRHKDKGVCATAVHLAHPDRTRRYMTEEIRAALLANIAASQQASGGPAFSWKTISQGAATSVWAGVVGTADAVGGHYCEDCHVAEIVADASIREGVKPTPSIPTAPRPLGQERGTGRRAFLIFRT